MIIYCIKNIVNNKIYIGKTTKTLTERFNSHLSSAKYGSNSILHKAIRKYGVDNFKLSIIESVIQNESILNDREIFWIKKFKPEYNMTSGGEGSSGRILSEESKTKMSTKAKLRIRFPHTEETKQKITQALIGNPLTQERKDKISKSKKGSIPWNKGLQLKPS